MSECIFGISTKEQLVNDRDKSGALHQSEAGQLLKKEQYLSFETIPSDLNKEIASQISGPALDHSAVQSKVEASSPIYKFGDNLSKQNSSHLLAALPESNDGATSLHKATLPTHVEAINESKADPILYSLNLIRDIPIIEDTSIISRNLQKYSPWSQDHNSQTKPKYNPVSAKVSPMRAPNNTSTQTQSPNASRSRSKSPLNQTKRDFVAKNGSISKLNISSPYRSTNIAAPPLHHSTKHSSQVKSPTVTKTAKSIRTPTKREFATATTGLASGAKENYSAPFRFIRDEGIELMDSDSDKDEILSAIGENHGNLSLSSKEASSIEISDSGASSVSKSDASKQDQISNSQATYSNNYSESQEGEPPTAVDEIFRQIIQIDKQMDAANIPTVQAERLKAEILSKQKLIEERLDLLKNPVREELEKMLIGVTIRQGNADNKFIELVNVDDLLKVHKIFNDRVRSQDEEVVKHDHILENLSYRNLRTLKPATWLNDEVINAFLRLVDAELESSYERRRVVNTFFFDEVVKKQAPRNKVMRMLAKKKIDVKKIDELILPINIKNSHWTFVVLDLMRSKIFYCDSLQGSSIGFARELVDFGNMLLEERNQTFNPFTVVKRYPHFPQQKNGYDCGIFMLRGIECLARGSSPSFSQPDAEYLRHLICFELVKGKLVRS